MDANFRGWIDALRYPVVTGVILGDFRLAPSIVESVFTLGELIPGKIEGFRVVEDELSDRASGMIPGEGVIERYIGVDEGGGYVLQDSR